MRDLRFDSDLSGSRYRRRLVKQGLIAAKEPWFGNAVETITAWCVETVRRMQRDGIASEDTVIVPDEALRESGSGIAGATNERLTSLTAWTPRVACVESDAQADWAWGAALARVAVQFAPRAEIVLLTWRTIEHSVAGAGPTLNALRARPTKIVATACCHLMGVIAERVHDLRGCRAYGDNEERFAAALASWWDTAQLESAWELRPLEYAAVSFDEVWMLDAGRTADPERYLALIEKTRNPLVARELLQVPAIVEDFEEIVRLLGSAPTTRAAPSGGGDAGGSQPNGDGDWNHRLTAPLLLGTAPEHATRLAWLQSQAAQDGGDDVGASERLEQDLRDRFQRLVRVALDRNDSVPLIACWLSYLARDISHTPAIAKLSPAQVALHAGARTLIARSGAVAAYQTEAQRSRGGGPSLGHIIIPFPPRSDVNLGVEGDERWQSGGRDGPSR